MNEVKLPPLLDAGENYTANLVVKFKSDRILLPGSPLSYGDSSAAPEKRNERCANNKTADFHPLLLHDIWSLAR